ncbi:hypothetical protein HOV93_12210 [Planctomycetes bacterium FF15]|uniref:Uncharacterized protein n=2 Tax=Bremerella alba TaxID=980252 RepID=A0A7V9A664_9BACT|nr:hypothetical protein [Bremerella alba]
MHVSVDFDLAMLRRELSRGAANGLVAPLFSKVERSKRGKRSHLHFLWHDDPDKAKFRSVLVMLLNKQGVESKSLRLSISRIKSKRAVFRYFSKSFSNFATEKRKTFTVGNFYTKPAKELASRTPKQIWDSKINHIAMDPLALEAIRNGLVDRKNLADPRWLSFWKRVGRKSIEGVIVQEFGDEGNFS